MQTGAMALVCVRSMALLAYAYPCAMPCRDTSMEREQWGLRRPPGGSFARTHVITDASEP